MDGTVGNRTRMALRKVGEVGHFIRDQRRSSRLSLRKLSSLAGVSNPYLSQIERGLRRPSAEILQAIAKALRISAETLYVKAGILEERTETGVDPVTAILRDLTITDKQKQALIEIYGSFRHENELEGKGRAGRAAAAKSARAAAAAKSPRIAAAAKPARAKQARRAHARPAPKRRTARVAAKPARRTARPRRRRA